MAKHEVVTTNKEIDEAIGRAKDFSDEARATSIEYRPGSGLDLFVLRMNTGERVILPREKLEGLQDASRQKLAHVQILGNGMGLHWPDLDVDLSISELLQQVYGTKRWMAQIGRRGGAVRSDAKAIASRENGRLGGRPPKRVVRKLT